MAYLARLFAATVRWGLACCALVLVLAALYVSLGRELVPLVAEYRLEAEDKARAALGMPLAIGSLEGRWQGLAPLLIAHDVQLGDGASALRLDQVRLVPDVFASLLARAPRVAKLELDGLQFSVLQDAQGAWTLKGLPQRSEPAPVEVAEVLRHLQAVSRLSLLNSQVTLEAHAQPALTLTYVNLTLRNGASRQRLDGRLLLPDGQPVALQLRTRMHAERWREAQAELYLSVPQSDWARWLPPSLTREWRLEQLQAGGEIWLTWARGAVQRAVSRLHAPQLAAAYAERKAVQLQNLALNAYFTRTEQGFEVVLDDLALSQGDTRWGEAQLGLTHQQDSASAEEQWLLSADRLDLAPLLPLVEALAPLPDKHIALVHSLQAHGAVSNLHLDYRPRTEGAKRLQFAANLDGIGFAAYQAAPAAENISGSVSGDLEQGELRLASENFSLHLDTLFPQPWRYRQANARLTWQLDEQAFTLRSPYLQVVGEEGAIAGDFLIRLMRDAEAEDYMDLRVGLRDGDARFTEKYLPTRAPGLSTQLADWLKAAIRGGAVDEGFFQYQGSLNKGAENSARSLSLFFAVHDAELAFQPGWPALREARGEVFIEDSGVRVQVSQGRLLNSQVNNLRADIPTAAAGQAPRLQLDGQLQSNVVDALKILQETPLGTAETFAGWQGDGPLSGRLKLDLPLRQGLPPEVVVDFATEGARLKLSNPTLELDQLQGAFRYNTASGLSAADIRAQVLGHAVRGKAVAEGVRGHARSRIEAHGLVPLNNLSSWLGVTQPLPLSGTLPYRLRLTLDGDDSQLRVDSNLKGLAIALPAPFGKAAATERYADWRMSLGGRERRYWLDYAELASLSFAAPPGQLGQGRGELRLGDGPATLPAGIGVRVRGQVSELDWAAWQAALKPYASVPRDDAQQLFKDANLKIRRFSGFGGTLDNLAVQLKRAPTAWALTLDSQLLKGQVDLPDASAAAIAVNLDYLRLPAAEPKAPVPVDKPDPLADVDPRQIPALDVRIAQVSQGTQVLGAWSLKARPNTNGVQFNDLSLDLKGLLVSGSAGWQGTPGASRSWYKGRLQGDNLADVLQAWGFAPTASSESFRLDVDGNWPGSPAWVSLKRFSGSMDAALRKGQFSEVQGSASALRVFGLLNFNSIGRRLRLDFSDLFGKGLSYDRVKGLLAANDGVFVTRTPITLTGPSSNLELDGTLDMADQLINAKLLVTLPVTNNLPLAALIVGAPAIGGALFVVDKLLGDRVARFASVQYDVKGPLQEPQITFDKPFEKPQ
ncbi:YhdP family protein [Pseudomonas sp. UBA2684]|uniref:YhdP family protein n=1 Tax=Pseudomonas sp. UBA2684 TaxID=1947311 RepID=UPI000E93B0BB|nr:YhdP family protein [Pseudomonas sp. UBA2684]HBX54273.1 TIGR02099 family protein [Pseudomonas sp.]|tara:strand:- start:942 stop:4769 length:3828 start_codon:yes stop_codon:yes gene_type:complete